MSGSPRPSGDDNSGWVAGWEGRQQAKFDREQAEFPAKQAEFEARNVFVDSPTGRHYIVRAVPMGRSLLTRGGIVTEIVRTFRAAEKKNRWTVGVVRDSLWSDAIVCKEYLRAGADEKARTAEVAESVRNGTLTVRNRRHPRRRI